MWPRVEGYGASDVTPGRGIWWVRCDPGSRDMVRQMWPRVEGYGASDVAPGRGIWWVRCDPGSRYGGSGVTPGPSDVTPLGTPSSWRLHLATPRKPHTHTRRQPGSRLRRRVCVCGDGRGGAGGGRTCASGQVTICCDQWCTSVTNGSRAYAVAGGFGWLNWAVWRTPAPRCEVSVETRLTVRSSAALCAECSVDVVHL